MTDYSFNAERAKSYIEGPPRQVPGYESLHKMVALLLAEKVPMKGRILVLGAGGGLEIKALAEMHPEWRFEGIDPSGDMISLAKQIVRPYADRVNLKVGYINSASEEPFDAAISLLTFHFISHDQSKGTLAEIHRRLKPGAPLLLAHLSIPRSEPQRTQWLTRHIVYGQVDQLNAAQIERSVEAMQTQLTILEPKEEEEMLYEAGFPKVDLFYAGLALKGWIAYTP